MPLNVYKEVYVESESNVSCESLVTLPDKVQLPPSLARIVETKSYDWALRAHSVNHILLAFYQLGIPKLLERSRPDPLSTLNEKLAIQKRFYPLTKHLFIQLEAEGFLSSMSPDTWRLLTPFPERDWLESQIVQCTISMANLYPERRPFLKLWNDCCKALPQILKGEIDPRDHLFPAVGVAEPVVNDIDASSFARSARAVDSVDGADFWYTKMPEVQWRDEALRIIMQGLHLRSKARLLEISMGRDSSTTRGLLSVIDQAHVDMSYTVANPSVEHLCVIKAHLPEQSTCTLLTQPLNIEFDPKLQGLIPKSYDVVVSINSLHITKNIRNSLMNVRQLLKSNGLLILCERTQPSLGLDLTFGLLGDWWRFDEADRPYPLLQHEQWIRMLKWGGFEIVAAFPNPESVFVARLRPHISPPPSPSMSTPTHLSPDHRRHSCTYNPWIVVSNEEVVKNGLIKLLSSDGDSQVILSSPSCMKGLMPPSYAGVVCICKDDMKPLLDLASFWTNSVINNVDTKFVLVLSTETATFNSKPITRASRHCLFDRMTKELAQTLALLGGASSGENASGSSHSKITFTLIEHEERKEDQTVAEIVDRNLDFKIYKELWVQNLDNWTYRYGRHDKHFEREFLQLGPDDLEENGDGNSKYLEGEDSSPITFVILQDDEWSYAETLPAILQLLDPTHCAVSCTYKIIKSNLVKILFELCELHKESLDLRILITTTESTVFQFPLLYCFCEALTHYRSRGGLRGNLIKIRSADGEDPIHMMNGLSKSVFEKHWTLSVVDSSTLSAASLTDFETNGGESPGGSSSQAGLWQAHGLTLSNIRNSISVGAGRKSSLAALLIGKSPSEQLGLVREVVLESVCQVSGFTSSDFEETQGFQDMGLDSVNIRDLAVRLGCSFDIDIHAATIFDHPTPQLLIEYILDAICEDDRIRSARRQSSYVLFDEDIAIIGASCRVSSASTLDEFWKLLAEGTDCIREVPISRFDVSQYRDVIYNSYGSFLEDVAGFDCNFFQISPNEAELVDPQHRLLLQLVWEALENASIPPDSLEGSKTSVFIGMCNADYKEVVTIPPDASPGSYLVTSNLQSVTAGRISYFLGLHGPCVCIDTACSSSLVAVDLACASLRAEESPLAIVGGINLICSPEMYIKYCGAKMLSRGNVCRPFDDSADGMIRGEAGVVLVLKRLTEAMTDGDNVLGVIRGTGTNQDGASAGLTAPNGHAQAALIRRVLKKANLRPGDIGYVEAHGTGTALGDPIELNALETIFGPGSTGFGSGSVKEALSPRGSLCARDGKTLPLYIGSVKANVGHTEGTAGILGLLKVCLALKHSKIPPQINVRKLNRQISNPTFFQLPRRLTRWDWNKVGCVSSFGVSGTNAFAVVEQPPDYSRFRQHPANWASLPTPFLFTVSAKTNSALTKLLGAYETICDASAENDVSLNQQGQFAAVAYTSNVGRAHFKYRAPILANDRSDLHEQLKSKSHFISSAKNPYSTPQQSQQLPLCFIFTGQGSQYKEMGKELYERAPHFRQVFEDCVNVIEDLTTEGRGTKQRQSKSIVEMFSEDESEAAAVLADPILSQLALFSLEYSLARFWLKIGLQPTHLIGHSLGEYVAAAISDVMSLENAVKLIKLRAKLIQSKITPNSHGMMAVTLNVSSSKAVESLVQSVATNGVVVSAYNSTSQIVLSGPVQALQEARSRTAGCAGGILLKVPYAYHSPQMVTIVDEFKQELANMSFSKPKINIISTVTGLVQTEFSAEHWIQHLVGPVKFLQAVNHLMSEGSGNSTTNTYNSSNVFLEIGPKPVLTPFCKDILAAAGKLDDSALMYYSMKQGESNWTSFLSTVAQLYVLGVNFHFKELYSHRVSKVELPGYPFENIKCWSTRMVRGSTAPLLVSSSLQKDSQSSTRQRYTHPLAGLCLVTTKKCIIWDSTINVGNAPHTYLSGHAFLGKVILPGAAFVEIALEAALRTEIHGSTRKENGVSSIKLRAFTVALPLVLEPQTDVPLQTIVTPAGYTGTGGTSVGGSIEINSASVNEGCPPDDWRTFAACEFEVDMNGDQTNLKERSSIESIMARLTKCDDAHIIWSHFASTDGVEFGSTFKMIRTIWTSIGQQPGETLAEVCLDLSDTEMRGYNVHPVVLDNAYQAVISSLIVASSPLIRKPFMVSSISQIKLCAQTSGLRVPFHVYVHVTDLVVAEESFTANIALMDHKTGELCMEIEGFHGQATTRDLFERLTSNELLAEGLYEEVWRDAQIWPTSIITETVMESELMEKFRNLNHVGENHMYEELCMHYIRVALNEIGLESIFEMVPSHKLTASKFCEIAGVVPIQSPLVEHFFRRFGLVQNTGTGEWTLTHDFRTPSHSTNVDLAQLKQKVLASNPGKALFGLVNTCGEHLSRVLQGKVDPLELLFPPEESPNFAYSAAAVYKESPGIQQGNTTLEQLLGNIVSQYQCNAAGNVNSKTQLELSILEIGAGTGSTSRHILKALRGAAEASTNFKFKYTYTDISASFFLGARESFGSEDNGMIYKVLNIEQDPMQQGFAPFSYDMVIGANVLHATQIMRTTIANARKLLRQGGLILILEATTPALSMDLTFGLTDGWWRFAGRDPLRIGYPLMKCGTWEKLLLESNFSHVKYLEFEESIILGRANSMNEFYENLQTRQASKQTSDDPDPHTIVPWVVVTFCDQPEELLKLLQCVGVGEPTVIMVQATFLEDPSSWPTLPSQIGAVIFDAGKCKDPKLLSTTFLTLAQALVNTGTVILYKFLVRTHGAIALPPEHAKVSNPFQAILWGMARTVRTEHPELKCTTIECENWFETLQEVYTADNEGMVFYGPTSRKVARLSRLLSFGATAENKREGMAERPLLFKSDRTYLITGGMGGLGLSLVAWMYDHGARHFALLARTLRQIPGNDALQSMPELDLKTIHCDVSNKDALERVLTDPQTISPDAPLAGIFHLAGALADAAMLQQNSDTLHVTYAPKVYGTWNLHELSVKHRLELDYFVLFSSLASLIGSGGQVNHASANAFMDAVAHFRVSNGLPALSVNWGIWAEIGSAQGRKLIRGLKSFTPEHAYSVLEKGLRYGSLPQFGVSLFDWNLYETRGSKWYSLVAPHKERSRSLERAESDDLENTGQQTSRQAASEGDVKVHEDGKGRKFPTTSKDIQKTVVRILRKLTGFSQIALDAPFRQLGVDSLMIIELRNRIQAFLKLTLPMTLMFEHPNVLSLSEKLLEMVLETNPPGTNSTLTDNSSAQSAPLLKPSPRFDNAELDGKVVNLESSPSVGVSDSIEISTPEKVNSCKQKPSPGSRRRTSLAISTDASGSILLNGDRCSYGSTTPESNPVSPPRSPFRLSQATTWPRDLVDNPTVTRRVSSQEGGVHTEVAVIGMACKIGTADSPEEFWNLALEGRHSVQLSPRNRRELSAYFDANPNSTSGGKPYGSFINDHDLFDHNFFHLSKHEAALMDPQQRLLLQVCWHALENAGLPPDQLKGSKTGLFIGISGHDYSNLLTRADAATEEPFLTVLGNAHCIAAGRISQFLGLQGPSMAIDTACSSSLVALHLGVQALRTGKADTVLVGGSNLLLSHDKFIGYDRGGMLSEDGMTRSFDTAASGFVRGEGVAVVALKRMTDLVKSDTVLAVIVGTAVSHSGIGAGLGAPTRAAQESLIKEALQDAEIPASRIDYVEAQGSGSKLGDAIELNSMETIFGTKQSELLIGTAKPNVGHLEACSGLAGLIKIIMSMAKNKIPPVLNFQTLNPDVRNTQFVNIPRAPVGWPSNEKMIAGLASMGYGGTNAFAIIQNSVPSIVHDGVGTRNRSVTVLPPPFLFPVSARSGPALRALLRSYYQLLTELVDDDLPRLAYSMTTTRSHHSQFRQAFVASSKSELVQKLKTASDWPSIPVQTAPEVFLFHIAGSFHMPLLQLYNSLPLFAKVRERMAESLASQGLKIEDLLESTPLRPIDPAVSTSDNTECTNSILHDFSSQLIITAALLDLGLCPDQMEGFEIGGLVTDVLTDRVTLNESWKRAKATAGLRKQVSFSRSDSNEKIQVKKCHDRGSCFKIFVKHNASSEGRNNAGTSDSIRETGGATDTRMYVISDWASLISTLGELYQLGMDLNLELLYNSHDHERVNLPLYPFENTRHWYN